MGLERVYSYTRLLTDRHLLQYEKEDPYPQDPYTPSYVSLISSLVLQQK